MNKHEVHISFRIPQKTHDCIEDIRSKMATRNAGIEVEKSQVIRLAIEKGLEIIKKDIGE